MTKKIEFINVDTGDKVYVDLQVATDEARNYYTRKYIIDALNILRLTHKITTQQYRSERGKIKSMCNNNIEVIKFINRFDDSHMIKNLLNKIKDLYNKEFVKLSHNKYMEIAKPKIEDK